MTINKKFDNNALTIALEGFLDTTTAPQLEKTLEESLTNVNKLIFDFSKLDYISSAGLRVLLVAQKIMKKQGEMIVLHPNKVIIDIFTITGFVNVLNIEDV